MATRNRTRVFLKYRATTTRVDSGTNLGDGSDNAFLEDDGGEEKFGLDRSTLPPEWVDIVEKIEDDLKAVDSKRKSSPLCVFSASCHQFTLTLAFDFVFRGTVGSSEIVGMFRGPAESELQQ